MISSKTLIKNLFYFIGSKKIIQSLVKPWSGNSLILCYHRIKSNSDSYFNPCDSLNTSKELFESQISYISSNFKIVSLDEMLENKNDNQFRIAITFDDGYKDNISEGLPILEKYNAPLTLFISTRFLKEDKQTWWYDLWELFKSNEKIKFSLKNKEFCLRSQSLNEKIKNYNFLSNELIMMNYSDQKVFLDDLLSRYDFKKTNQEFLCEKDVKILASNDLVTIGCHTHTHASLAHLSNNEIKIEMENSKSYLEDLTKKRVDHIAYPYGRRENISRDVISNAKNLGFTYGYTTICNPLDSNNNYRIPRHTINNSINIKRLKTKISGFNSFWKIQAS